MEDDLTILQKETKLSRITTEQLLKECNGDVVTAILRHNGEEDKHSENSGNSVNSKNKKELTEAQQKIKILRDIADKKDEMLDNMMERQKKANVL